MSEQDKRACEWCGKPLVARKRTKRFCAGSRCRTASWRAGNSPSKSGKRQRTPQGLDAAFWQEFTAKVAAAAFNNIYPELRAYLDRSPYLQPLEKQVITDYKERLRSIAMAAKHVVKDELEDLRLELNRPRRAPPPPQPSPPVPSPTTLAEALAILGLRPGATRAEAQRRFSDLAHQLHPDKNPNADVLRFRQVVQAWEVCKAAFSMKQQAAGF